MKHRIAFLLSSLLLWSSCLAHPGGLGAHSTPESRKAHAELLAETIKLVADIQTSNTSATTPTNATADEKQTPQNDEPAVPKNDGVRVSVLGYHDFSTKKKATAMIIPTEKFRKQMKAIKDLGLNVITLADFMAWKRGEKTLPDKSILITIDDGWKAVYTDAYPILKEFGFPFTIFLYTNYVDGGGSALTTDMIQEMEQHGCTIGSHSVSHPYPSKIKSYQKKGPEVFTKYLHTEMADSKKILESKFKQPVTTYAYPGGYVTPEMLPVATDCGYQFLFTVLPGKIVRATDNMTLPRYIILGTHDYIFRNATSFKATRTSRATHGAMVQLLPHPVTPAPGSLTPSRTPTISADLSKVSNLDPESIVMRVAGFGKVPAKFDSDKHQISWKINRPLHARECKVSIQWRLLNEKKYQKAMVWTFQIDREASYVPKKLPTD